MNKPVLSIVVVGGGTAGWITAGRIAAHHRTNANSPIQVTLVESPNIPIIGVGEGTWPTMRSTLMKLGISETDFIRECDASFKQGAKFARWTTGASDDFYYHPLMLPQGFGKTNLVAHWQKNRTQLNNESFSATVCFQEAICEQGLAPKMISTPEFSSVANYAYHLNAGKFSQFLQRHCCEKLGVRHILADVIHVNSNDHGDITSVTTAQAGNIAGDLFVDCTGFSSLLLGQHLQVPFIDHSDVLFIDTALAAQIPYEHENSPIASHTISTAQSAGWIWDIGLRHRRGIGHVYSSRHTNEERAMEELQRYIGPAFNQASVRKIPIHCGHRKIFWKNNCVAVGLSAGFLEPLEASALVLVELSATFIAEQLPARREVMDITAKRFNETFQYRWQRIIDFLKLHYILSKRTDSEFWIDNRDKSTIPPSLQELMELWRYQAPGDLDFSSNNEVFPAASYQYVLYGMGFETDFSNHAHLLMDKEFAHSQFIKTQKAIAHASSNLPGNRELLNKIYEYGLQTI
ncbi:MAG: tryptophan halogenase [Cellvibrio sp. 79]|nr:MAG: tryptophan halogenase [Cellvibrio sp. 79]